VTRIPASLPININNRLFRYLSCGLLLTAGFCSAVDSRQWIHQHERFIFDEANVVVFEDIGRRSFEKGYVMGNQVRLNIKLDDEWSEWDLIPADDRNKYPISPDAISIQYRDRTHIWMLSRLGDGLNGAVFLDLEKQVIERGYAGQLFMISPDSQHVAYCYPTGQLNMYTNLFLDGIMVYPQTRSGFNPDGHPEKFFFDETKGWFFPDGENQKYVIRMASIWNREGQLECLLEPEKPADAMQAAEPAAEDILLKIEGLDHPHLTPGKIRVASERMGGGRRRSMRNRFQLNERFRLNPKLPRGWK
jgi:hypothetical protein